MKTTLLVFPNLLIALVSLPMALRLVPPNPLYGMRTARTLASPATWYAANFRAGAAGVALGLAGAAFAVAILRNGSLSDLAKVLLATGAAVVAAIGAALAGFTAS